MDLKVFELGPDLVPHGLETGSQAFTWVISNHLTNDDACRWVKIPHNEPPFSGRIQATDVSLGPTCPFGGGIPAIVFVGANQKAAA